MWFFTSSKSAPYLLLKALLIVLPIKKYVTYSCVTYYEKFYLSEKYNKNFCATKDKEGNISVKK